ncbi:uncharacterized protein LOC8279134 [Ricinus communis]|uniref:uncharacterized protein LOC8279134 n=1 Tax=Ricinus communis TaxID=3988 RepID=UPI000772C21B|nr:uncharacterized protein LOC8279134 [Ricinus communis]|eukprot:XP_015576276.1 uncharacterized protein LOC8279134 isoform X2 [Ricinus communis]
MSSENPRKWRFTWEAQSHSPTLKLLLFDSQTKPSIQCNNLRVNLNLSQSHLLLTWIDENTDEFSLKVPIPKVLIDPDCPFSFRALDDHIEAKLVLLLPVDHPIFTNLSLVDDGESNDVLDCLKPLYMDSDLKSLSSMEEVHFYCRSCSTRLTANPLRHFVELPSVNWRETADNWFGACCCSFGGISEKLVNRYADAYTCAKGVCLLSPPAVTLCKDDLVECKFVDCDGIQRNESRKEYSGPIGLSEESMLYRGSNPKIDASCDNKNDSESVLDLDINGTLRSQHINSNNLSENVKCEVKEEEPDANRLFCVPSALDLSENVASRPGCCNSMHHALDDVEVSTHEVHQPSLLGQITRKAKENMANRRSILNGFLGGVFMARSYNLSMDVQWKQFVCPQCSTLLGAYPCADDDVPLDDGVRLFKCYLSTSLPVGGSADLFRKYNLEKMFTNQLVESAKDELSFRTVVRDLTTKNPMLQVVLVNPNSWYCTGSCEDAQCSVESVSKLELRPIIKLLFSNCSNNKESQLRVLQDWVSKNQADEFFMLPQLIEKLTETMTSAKNLLPPSCTFFQNLSLSFMLR